ncbi:hypothetical protein FIBSPDRAFT_864411, partial [Athelia psychrophila]
MRLTCLTTRELILTQDLIGRLIDRLSSEHSSNMHAAVPELVNGVISKGALSPGAAHRNGASKLVGYVLADYNPSPGEENESLTTPLAQPPQASSSPT